MFVLVRGFEQLSGDFELSIILFYIYVGVASCDKNYTLNPLSETCVGIHGGSLDWYKSEEHCEDMGEHLLTLQTIEDAEWLYQQMLTDQGTSIRLLKNSYHKYHLIPRLYFTP